MKNLLILVSLSACVAVGQTIPPGHDSLSFARVTLMTLASPDFAPNLVAPTEDYLTKRLGLSTQDLATIDGAAQTLRSFLAQARQSEQTIVAGKASLTSADNAALAGLVAQRDTLLANLLNQIMQNVSADVATKLLAGSQPVVGPPPPAPTVAKGTN
jgi:hypothetical protein